MTRKKRRPFAPKPVVVPASPPPRSVPAPARSATRTHSLLALVIVILALTLRLGVVSQLQQHDPFADEFLPDSDERSFVLWAERIAGGDALGEGSYIQSPLYPWLLAVVFKLAGPKLVVVKILQALLDAAAAGLVWWLGSRIFSPPVGAVAGLLYALNPVPAFYATRILRDTPMPFFTLLVLVLAHRALGTRRGRDWLLAGLAAGLAQLLRENFQTVTLALGAVLLAAPAFQRQWRTHLAPFGIGVILVLGLVFARNLAVGAPPLTVTQNGAVAFVMGNAADASGVGYVVPASADRITADHPGLAGGMLATLATHRENPFGLLGLYLRKLHALIGRLEIANNENFYYAREFSPLLNWPLPTTAAILPFALVGFALLLRRETLRDPGRLLLGGFALVYGLTLLLFFIIGRFRLPLVPVASLLAAVSLVELVRGLRGRQFASAAALAAGVVLAAAVVAWPTAYEDEVGNLLDREYFSRAQMFQARNDTAAARAWLTRAVELKPDYAVALNKLAVICYNAGDTMQAIAHFAAATRGRPPLFEAWHNLGQLQLDTGDPEAAVGSLREALVLRPEQVTTRIALGSALLDLGRYADAARELETVLQYDPGNEPARQQLMELKKVMVP